MVFFSNPIGYAPVHHALGPRRETLHIGCNFRVLHELLAGLLRALRGWLGKIVLGGSREIPVRLSLDARQQVRPVPLEERVPKFDFVYRPLHFVEVVHVELPDEGVKIVMLKMEGQNRIGEPGLIFDLEEVAVRAPGDAVLVLVIVDNLEHFLKKGGHAFLSRLLRRRFIHLVMLVN